MIESQSKHSLSCAALVLVAVAGPTLGRAGAASAPVRAPAVNAVLLCRGVSGDAERLACFDRAVADMAQAETKGDLVTVDREQRRAVRRQAFGLSLPLLSIFDRGEKGEDVDRITTQVTGAHQGPTGKWIIELEGGAVWRQIDDQEMFKTPHRGSSAVIRRAALGSFFMKVDGDSAMRVHRDN